MRIHIVLSATLVFMGAPLPASDDDESWIRQTVYGMDCAPCAYGVERSLSRVPGVSSVEVSLNRGVATIGLTGDAEPDLAVIREIVRRNGFTPKDAELRLAGMLVEENGEHWLEVGTRRFTLVPTGAVPGTTLERLSGRNVTVTGRITEDAAERIVLHAITR